MSLLCKIFPSARLYSSTASCPRDITGFQQHFLLMAHYNQWANTRLYDSILNFPSKSENADEEISTKPRACAFFGTILATLNHILVADLIWLSRIRADGYPVPDECFQLGPDNEWVEGLENLKLNQILFEDMQSLWRARQRLDAAIQEFCKKSIGNASSASLQYRSSLGVEHKKPLVVVLTHFFNHQTHHRGQVHAMLLEAGCKPPPLDLVYFANELYD